jgi:hypothetical protein
VGSDGNLWFTELNGSHIGRLTVGGSVAAPVVNTGTLSTGAAPGVVTVNGNYTQSSGDTLALKLNGTAAGTQYDQLSVNGSINLGGTLSLSVGFTPAAGTPFTILRNTGSGAITGTFAGMPQGASVTAGGATFQISYKGGTSGRDVVLTVAAPPTVTAVAVNDGTAQRSMVYSLTVTFDSVVTFATNPSAAFTLTRLDGAAVGSFQTNATTTNNGTQTQVVLSGFRGAETFGGSLADGRYTLTVLAGQVSSHGLPLDGDADGTGGDDYLFPDTGLPGGLYRLYGDANGDRVVNAVDLSLFRNLFGATTSDPTFDMNGDGVIDVTDLAALRTNFGLAL